jgi:hypothetical protein
MIPSELHRAVDRILEDAGSDLHTAVDEAVEDGWDGWDYSLEGVLDTLQDRLDELGCQE